MQQTAETRFENDLIGEKAVPIEAYYGIHTLRAYENFQYSHNKISDTPALIKGVIFVKKAAAMANKQLRTLDASLADIIIQACDLVISQNCYQSHFPLDVFQGGAGTSINMNVNEVLANIGLELMGYAKGAYHFLHPTDHVNQSQSTNDVYPTGLRLAIYDALVGNGTEKSHQPESVNLVTTLTDLSNGFNVKAKSFRKVLKMGRTQLQDAVPMTLGQELHAFHISLQEEAKNIRKIAKQLLIVNLGATAIGTGINTPPGYQHVVISMLREVTGLPCTAAKDLIQATADCTIFVTIHSALKRLAIKLSKICNDLRLLSSGPRAGFHEINLPPLQAGSSIMPAKVNPVIPEATNQICFKVIGNDTCIALAAEAGQLQLNVMEPVISQAIFESIMLLTNGCKLLLEKCVTGITANPAICSQYVFNNIGLVTYLNPFIGHEQGDKIGKICAQTGKSVREVVLELGLLTDKELNKIFNINHLIYNQNKEID